MREQRSDHRDRARRDQAVLQEARLRKHQGGDQDETGDPILKALRQRQSHQGAEAVADDDGRPDIEGIEAFGDLRGLVARSADEAGAAAQAVAGTVDRRDPGAF
jgi:hypothetical protein